MEDHDFVALSGSQKEPSAAAFAAKTEPLWTVEDLAQYLRLEPQTVRTMARDGKLPAIKIGRVWRFRRSDLLKFLVDSQGDDTEDA